jgi:hypothetical protein
LAQQPQKTQDSDPSGTLPPPELNPLLNPLLGQHMGRWAEVYFTAAPEQREGAVLALLRELESKEGTKAAESFQKVNSVEPVMSPAGAAPPTGSLAASSDVSSRNSFGMPTPPRWIDSVDAKSVTCESCGHAAPRTQRFCGMCGAPLQEEEFGGNDYENDAWAERSPTREFDPIESEPLPETIFPFNGVYASKKRVPYRYRISVGAALILLITLAIMAYRGAQDWSRSSHPLPQAAPGEGLASAARPAAKPETRAAVSPTGNEKRPDTVASDAVEKSAPPERQQAKREEPPSPRAAVRTAEPASTTYSSVRQGNGWEELSVAERYLTGAHGNARDSKEAARWLWQAVSKQNASAVLLLSDLYLRGEGVPKNCDQARLLLVAAARKGAPGAGERLRNLRAFNCQ